VFAGNILGLRKHLGLSRSELARFLGVSEASIVRWESEDGASEPKGLQAVLLQAISDAADHHPPRDIARAVRRCGLDHREALKTLLAAAG
jgi:transcriptional regulator with XRE-family HTH domain